MRNGVRFAGIFFTTLVYAKKNLGVKLLSAPKMGQDVLKYDIF